MFSTLWFATLVVFVLPVILQGAFAYADAFLTPAQVELQWGRGLPFLLHGGMWLDVLFFAPLMAYIVSVYGPNWHRASLIMALAVGLLASYAMHTLLYVPGGEKIAEAHTHGGTLTLAGWVHVFYMTAGIAVLALYYFSKPGMAPAEVWTISGLLFIHVTVGNHIPFKMWVARTQPSWYPVVPVMDMGAGATLAGVAIALIGVSLWATRAA